MKPQQRSLGHSNVSLDMLGNHTSLYRDSETDAPFADDQINEKEEFLLAGLASSLSNRGSTFREADPHLWPSAVAML